MPMRNKKVFRLAIILLIAVITLILGCSSEKIEPANTSNSNNSTNNDSTENPATSPDIKSYSGFIQVIGDFIMYVKSSDTESLKSIVSPSGLIVIRNFSSGSGARGKDIRIITLANEIPGNLQFEVTGELLIILDELYGKFQQTQIVNTPVVKLNDSIFNFKDNAKNRVYEPSTDNVIDICGEIISTIGVNNQYSPKIFELGDDEIVLTESALIADSPIGVWTVFKKADDRFFLRAIIDLR